MVNLVGINKQSFIRKSLLFSIALLLIANLSLVNFVFAKRLELNSKQVEQIKTGLSLAKALGNIVLTEDKLKTVLNTIFVGGETSVDITYGLLVLSAVNEMEFMDLVVSQRYKQIATDYFNSILDEKSNLLRYYKGIGFDLPKVLSGKITGPISALTLNTFSITNEAMRIFAAFENLRTEKLYDGLWRYFDERRNGSAHREAWELARYQLGWAVNSSSYLPQKLKNRDDGPLQLQFAQLWDKWGQHTNAFGVTVEAKRQFNEEMNGLVAQAIETHALAEKMSSPSPLANLQATIANLTESVKRLSMEAIGFLADKAYALTKYIIASIAGLTSLGGAGLISIEPIQQTEGSGGFVEALAEPSSPQIQQEVVQEPQAVPLQPFAWCTIDYTQIPFLGSTIFYEVAWMGNVNSANDEWVKLKNISNNEVNLAGWQMQDQDTQIRIAFSKDHVLFPQGILILERTSDDSLPGTTAHVVYTGGLSNTNEALYLFDQNCTLRDKVLANPNWPAGESDSREPMQRNSDLSWSTIENVSVASSPILAPTPTPTPTPTLTPTPTPTPLVQPALVYLKILISEIQIEGQSAKDEFIELYNPNSQAVDLKEWSLKKKTSGGSDSNLVSAAAFSGTIAPYGYFLVVPALNDDGTPNYTAGASPDLYYSGKTYSLAPDNTVFLYDPNKAEVDRVGFGQSPYAKGDPAPNPLVRQSLSRKISNGVYHDTNDNTQDFHIQQTLTPKAVNTNTAPLSSSPLVTPPPPPPPPPDTTPPQATLTSLTSPQSNTYFSLSWTATDPTGNASPSGLQNIFLEYSITPSAAGVFAQYNNNGVWTDWQQSAAGKLTLGPTATTLNVLARDGISYTFQVKAKDVAGNESVASSASTAVSLARNVVINEVAWAGTKAFSSDEWLELRNITGSLVDLAGWKIKSSDAGGPEITLSGTIAANGFYLIERTNDQVTSAVANLTASFGNGLSNTPCEVLYLHNAQDAVVDQTICKSDGGWPGGVASPDYISMERIASTAGSSIGNWASNNLIKYNSKDAGSAILYDGTPGNVINGTPKQANSAATSPTTITEITLRFDEFSTLTLPKLSSPYITTASITIPAGKTLVVEPGVLWKFQDNTARLTVQGTLTAQGTQANGITFTVTDGGAVWCGIKVDSTSTGSQLNYLTIDKAGGINCNPGIYSAMYVESSSVTMNNSVIQTGASFRKLYLKNSNSTINALTASGATLNADSVGVYIDGGSPTISNSTISNNSIGIYVNSLSSNPTIQNNTFTSNTYAVKLESAGVLLSGNTATSNTYNGIFFEGAIASNTTWQKDAIPYIANSFTVNAGVTLTIQAGVVVKFIYLGDTNPQLLVNGTLLAQGTAANPVVFTSTSDNTVGGSNAYGGVGALPSWKRIYIAQGSTGSQLTYTTLKYGGNTNFEGALYVRESSVQVSNITISNSAYSGIYSFNGTFTGSAVTLSSNTYGFHIQVGDCPALSSVTVTGTLLHPSSSLCSF